MRKQLRLRRARGSPGVHGCSRTARGDVQPEPGAFALGGEEGFENVVQLLGGDAGPIVEDLNDRQIAGFVAKQAEPDLSAIVLLAAVAQAVLHRLVSTWVSWLGSMRVCSELPMVSR